MMPSTKLLVPSPSASADIAKDATLPCWLATAFIPCETFVEERLPLIKAASPNPVPKVLDPVNQVEKVIVLLKSITAILFLC